MDAPEYVGRRAERALGRLPAALVGAAAVGAAAGLVGLWRLTTPTTGFVGGDAAGSLWQRVTMAVATGYDVAPLAWGALALVVLVLLTRTSRAGLPTSSPGVRRAGVLLAGVLVVLSVVAVVVVAVWAVLTHGEVTFSVEVPGDQDGGRVTTQVGTYQTDPWVALLHVVPAAVAAVLAGGSLAALLHPGPAPAVERVEATTTVPAGEPTTSARPAGATSPARAADGVDDGVDDGAVDGAEDGVDGVVDRRGDGGVDGGVGGRAPRSTDDSAFVRDAVTTGRIARGSGGAARFARSVSSSAPAGAPPRPGPASGDPLAGWTMGPGATSDVAFRRPGVGAGDARDSTDGGSNGSNGSNRSEDPKGSEGSVASDGGTAASPEVVAPTRDPYRRPGA